jgi:hypothetical protein
MPLKLLKKGAIAVALGLCAASLSACGADDVQLNGKIFDALGVSGNAPKSAEPKVAQRQPLVIPPGLEALPQPGSGAQASTGALAAIDDPDKKAKLSKAELQKQQDDYCRVHYTEALQRGDETADLAEGPLGRCQGSIFTAVKNLNKGDDDDTSAQ